MSHISSLHSKLESETGNEARVGLIVRLSRPLLNPLLNGMTHQVEFLGLMGGGEGVLHQ